MISADLKEQYYEALVARIRNTRVYSMLESEPRVCSVVPHVLRESQNLKTANSMRRLSRHFWPLIALASAVARSLTLTKYPMSFAY